MSEIPPFPPAVMVEAHRAQPVGDRHVAPVTIRIWQEFPSTAQRLTDSMALHERNAEAIAQALADSLPGGTFDRLVGKLLAMKASLFVIRHDFPIKQRRRPCPTGIPGSRDRPYQPSRCQDACTCCAWCRGEIAAVCTCPTQESK